MPRRLLPSRRLIAATSVLAAGFAALAFLPQGRAFAVPTAAIAGILLTLACVADAWLSLTDWRGSPLRLQRRLPQAFALGTPTTIQVCIDNPGSRAWRGEFHEHADASMKVSYLPRPFEAGAGQRTVLDLSLVPLARGLKRFEPAQLRLGSRFGLLDLDLRVGAQEERRVYPNFSQQARFAWLAGDARLPTAGLKSIQRRGSGTDFDQLVDYQPGDPIRHIDWKATQKQVRPIVRRFRDERDQRVMILLDCGRRMRADDPTAALGTSHFDQSLNALMLLAFVALSHGDAVGAMTFGTPPALHKGFAPRKGRQTLNALMAALADVEPSATFSDYERAAAELVQRQHKRSLVVVITNSRNEDAPTLAAALALLCTRHRVVLANLREVVVSRVASQPLADPMNALECAAAQEYLQARASLMLRLSRQGVLTVDCEPQRLAVELVNRYMLLKRSGAI